MNAYYGRDMMDSPSEPLRVGIIGTGVGLRTLLPGFHRTGRAEVVALAGSSLERATKYAQEHGIANPCPDYKTLCDRDDLDIICVASPNEYHLDHALAAFATGKAVYIEKPAGMSYDIAKTIAAAANETQALVVVGHQLRFNPYLRTLRDSVQRGLIGRPYAVEIAQRGGAFVSRERSWTWEFDEERGGGVRLAMGSHLLDLCAFLLGRMPIAASGTMDPVHLERRPDGGAARRVVASNHFGASFDFGDCSAWVSTSAASHVPGRFSVELLGTDGAFTFEQDGGLRGFRAGDDWSEFDVSTSDDYAARPGSSIFRKSFTYLADALVAAVARGETELCDAATVEDNAIVLKWLDEVRDKYLNDGPDDRVGY